MNITTALLGCYTQPIYVCVYHLMGYTKMQKSFDNQIFNDLIMLLKLYETNLEIELHPPPVCEWEAFEKRFHNEENPSEERAQH